MVIETFILYSWPVQFHFLFLEFGSALPNWKLWVNKFLTNSHGLIFFKNQLKAGVLASWKSNGLECERLWILSTQNKKKQLSNVLSRFHATQETFVVDITESNKVFHSGILFTLSALLHVVLIYNDSGNLQVTLWFHGHNYFSSKFRCPGYHRTSPVCLLDHDCRW